MMTLVLPPPALSWTKQVTRLMSHLHILPDVIWRAPTSWQLCYVGDTSVLSFTFHPTRADCLCGTGQATSDQVPLTSSSISQGAKIYLQ